MVVLNHDVVHSGEGNNRLERKSVLILLRSTSGVDLLDTGLGVATISTIAEGVDKPENSRNKDDWWDETRRELKWHWV